MCQYLFFISDVEFFSTNSPPLLQLCMNTDDKYQDSPANLFVAVLFRSTVNSWINCLGVSLKLCSAPHAGWQGGEVNSCGAGNVLAALERERACDAPAPRFSNPGGVCRSWHNTVTMLFASISPPSPQFPQTCPLPGTWCCFYSLVSLLKDSHCQVLLNNPPVSSLPDQVPFLLCSHPSNLGSSSDGATSALMPPGLPPPFPLQFLLLLPLAHTSFPSSPPYTYLFTAACSAHPLQPGFAPCSRLPPSLSPGLRIIES